MDFSLKNKEEKTLFELHLAFNVELLKEIFFSKSGIWNYAYRFMISFCLLYFFATVQIFLPNYYPEIPLYPLAIFFTYLAANYPPIIVYLLCFPAGIMMDSVDDIRKSNSPLSTLHSPLPTLHSPLPTPHSQLPTPHSPLPTLHSPLPH